MKASFVDILEALKRLVVAVWTQEPALVVGVVVAVVGAVGGSLGIVVPTAGVEQVVAYVVAVLAGSVAVRSRVSPK